MDAAGPVTPEHDSLFGHERGSDPWWNESAWFGFCVPEREINGFFYFWRRPNMGLTSAGIALWDPLCADRHGCLYYHWQPFNPLPDGDMFDFTLANGMSVETLQPLEQYQLRFEDPACQLDLVWTGRFPALEFSMPGKTFGSFHYDQLGEVKGVIELADERLEIDCRHVRDRSWGVRRPFPSCLRGGLEMGWASDGLAFCSTMLTPDGPADAVSDTADRLSYGQMVIDGVLTRPVEGERRVLERGADTRPLVIEIDLLDADGREIHARGQSRNNLRYADLWYMNWASVAWEINGSPGWGESQDVLGFDLVRRHERAQSLGRAT